MRGILALIISLLLCACAPMSAVAQGADAQVDGVMQVSDDTEAGAKLMGSLSGAWNTVSRAFKESYLRVRDDSVLAAQWAEISAQIQRAGQLTSKYMDGVYAQVSQKAQAAGISISQWLDSHSDDLKNIADQAGKTMGGALNWAGNALEQAGTVAGDFIDSLINKAD